MYDKLGKREKREMVELIDGAYNELLQEKAEGRGKLRDTIDEVERSEDGKERFVDEYVIYLPKEGEACFVGDLHGDLDSLKKILEDCHFIENMEVGDKDLRLVFEGDYIDRGEEDVEVLELIMDLKRRYPNNVDLLRGNHEYGDAKKKEGESTFFRSLEKKYNQRDRLEVLEGFANLFKILPNSLVTGNKIFAVHGGIPHEEINSLKDLNDKEVRWQMAWNDPDKNLMDGFKPNRGSDDIKLFGYKPYIKFMRAIGANTMVRSHQGFVEGVKDIWNERLITVFSNTDKGRVRPKYLRTSLEEEKVRWTVDDIKSI